MDSDQQGPFELACAVAAAVVVVVVAAVVAAAAAVAVDAVAIE